VDRHQYVFGQELHRVSVVGSDPADLGRREDHRIRLLGTKKGIDSGAVKKVQLIATGGH
jgi:hypothetical protein